VNKGDLVEMLAERASLSKAQASRVVDAIFDVDKGLVASALRRGDKVQITGFGSFEARKRGPRTARNPRTGEAIQVPAGVAPVFRAGKPFKDAVGR
jgi:DNA-binding protein HU-beta